MLKRHVGAGIEKVGADYLKQQGIGYAKDIDKELVLNAIHYYCNSKDLAQDLDILLQAECSFNLGVCYLEGFNNKNQAGFYFQQCINFVDFDPSAPKSDDVVSFYQ